MDLFRFYGCGLGSQRDGRFLVFWVSNRGENTLLAHDFALAKSSVFCLLLSAGGSKGLFDGGRQLLDYGKERAKCFDAVRLFCLSGKCK